jgi:hypothetical protein
MTIGNGNDRQTLTSVTERSDVRGSPSQLMVAFGSSRPSVVRTPLSTPNGFSTRAQIIPATTGARSQGRISSPRNRLRSRGAIRAWRRSARPRPIRRWPITLPTVKRSVCHTASQKGPLRARAT